MNTKKVLFALAMVATFIFVSCSPNSLTDEDELFEDSQGVRKDRITRDLQD